MSEAAKARSSVLPTARETSEATGRPVAMEAPRSPCIALPSQIANCTGSGRSKPYSARMAACCSAVASIGMTAVSGSPGAIWTSMKQMTLTPNATGMT